MSINWKSSLAHPDASILEVMKIIEQDALRAACIVDAEMMLKGIVTDGDIRRAIINGFSLDSKISGIMNRNPRTVEQDYNKDELIEYLKSNRLIHMPVVRDGQLVDLVTIEDLTKNEVYDNPVFIMAGGFGTRLRPLTDNCPKPMLKIGQKPILETIIDQFIGAGFHNFYVSTHYLPEKITSHFEDGSNKGVKITYVHEESPLGTGGALGLLPDNLIELPLLLINGDILTNINFEHLLHYHQDSKADATMAVREFTIQVPYGVVELDSEKIIGMTEKPSHNFFINAGIYVVSPQIVKSVGRNKRIDMPSLLQKRMSEGEKVSAFPIHEYWLDIGKMKDFEQAQIDVLQGAIDIEQAN